MKELSYIEITALVRELNALEGARVNKIYNPTKNEVILHFYSPQIKKTTLRIAIPNFITISEYKQEYPQKPSHFVMFLRKYLLNSHLTSVKQTPFERVVEFNFEKENKRYIVLCELFSKGNIIICDKDYTILIPLLCQVWKDRTVKPNEKYKFPPKNMDFEELDFIKFKDRLFESSKDQIVKSIAVILGLGGTYAEELCLRSEIDKTTEPKNLPDEKYRILFNNFEKLIDMSKEEEIHANIIYENNQPVDVQPFHLDVYAVSKKKEFSSFVEALDEFFATTKKTSKIGIKESEIGKEIAKQEAILSQHKSYLVEVKEKAAKLKRNGDLIYQNLGMVQDIVNTILQARAKNISWPEIIKKIESVKAKNKEAKLIKNILPDRGVIVLDLDSGIEIEFLKDVTQNANDFFNHAKKLGEKISGIEDEIAKTELRVQELKDAFVEVEGEVEAAAPKKIEKIEKEWHEKYHWLITYRGKLVIGGKDSTQNEVLMKKYIDKDDLILHTDAPGSPFTIIKNGKDADEREKSEAATLTLCYSKAWQNNRLSDVYAVGPEQVSKKAPAGEYIAKGAFMVYGKKQYIKEIELKYTIGIQLDPLKIISGPVENVRLKAKYYVILIPGKKDKDELSKQIKERFLELARKEDVELVKNIDVEEIKAHTIKNSELFGIIPITKV
jgi:predicted ribosome quality control (RQC) complex YloA/Tae2 family protein